MKNIVFTWGVLIAVMLGAACGSDNGNESTETSSETTTDSSTPEAELSEKVMGIHDEAMARMGEIYQLSKGLESELDSLKKTKYTGRVQEIKAALSDLKEADQGMREWMRAYDPSAADPSAEGAMQYLEGEFDKIKRVQKAMDKSIAQAQQMLQH
ncbi:MAG: hypothetical protein AAF804_07765 [Bacteroidota bacterium]